MNALFQKIIITGYGNAANKILKYVYEKSKSYKFQLECIEYEKHPLSVLKGICNKSSIPYIFAEDKKQFAEYLRTVQEKTLIVSAGNNFIFPEDLVNRENISIVNFHNALLPFYPGRNAQSWVIYKGEKETGITWHYVTTGIDEGDILIQKKCSVGRDMKAYELTEKLMELAYEAFTEIFDNVLEGTMKGKKQQFDKNRKVYYSYEIPSNGEFELSENPENIYRLMRSVDYGIAGRFPKMRSFYEGKKIEILRYRKYKDTEKLQKKSGCLYLPMGNMEFLELQYREWKADC